MNEFFELIGGCLDERRPDVLDCLDKVKSCLEDLHRLDSALEDFNVKIDKIFTYSNEESGNGYPMSRMILTHVLNSVNKLDISSLSNDIEKFKSKSKLVIFDRVTNDQNGIEDFKKQLKDLADKWLILNGKYLER